MLSTGSSHRRAKVLHESNQHSNYSALMFEHSYFSVCICACRVPTCQETVRVRTGEREALPNTRPLMFRFRATRFARAQALAAAREEGLLEAAGMLAAGVPFGELVLRGFPDSPPIKAEGVDDDLLARRTTKTKL